MGLYTFVGLAVTSSTKVIYGRIISNPVQLLTEIGGTITKILAILGISLATVTTNIPANFVAPECTCQHLPFHLQLCWGMLCDRHCLHGLPTLEDSSVE